MSKMFNGVIRLRRDNDFNYAKIGDTFVPASGEICLVDTARKGLMAVCGDGVTSFNELEYIGEVIVKGYWNDDLFYSDREYSTPISGLDNKVYIDLNTNRVYHYYEDKFVLCGDEKGTLPSANATTPGVMKLYNTVGYNEDGTMTQKAITDELDDKVEITLNVEEELIIFTT